MALRDPLCPLLNDPWLWSIDTIRQFELHAAATGRRSMDGNRDHLGPPAGIPFMLAASGAGSLQGTQLGGATLTFMEESLLTIHLDRRLTQQLEAACADTGRSRGEIVRDALRRQLSLIRFVQLQRQALPFGEAAGWFTDEDVFKAVS